VSLIMAAGAYALFLWEQRQRGYSLEEARTIAVNVIVVVQVFYLLNCRSVARSIFSVGWFSNPWLLAGMAMMLVAQGVFTYAPLMHAVFHTAPIHAEDCLRIAAVGAVTSAVVAVEKWLYGRKTRPLRAPASRQDA
jgi:cation-transporting ATPase F